LARRVRLVACGVGGLTRDLEITRSGQRWLCRGMSLPPTAVPDGARRLRSQAAKQEIP